MTMEYRSAYRIKKARRESELNRQRRAAVLGAVIAAVIICFAAAGGFRMTSTEAASSDAVCVTVRRGDSLWSLAGLYKPEDKDIRRFVRIIAEFNDMDGLTVYEGQTLFIPQ